MSAAKFSCHSRSEATGILECIGNEAVPIPGSKAGQDLSQHCSLDSEKAFKNKYNLGMKVKKMSALKFINGVIILFFTAGLCSAEVLPRTYWLDLQIEPDSGLLQVEGEILLSGIPQGQEMLFFNLHSSFKIEEIRIGERKTAFTTEPNSRARTVPASKMVMVRIPGQINRENATLRFAYRGKLQDIPEWGSQDGQRFGLDDAIDLERVELASYSNWYPFWYYGVHFDFEMKVSLPENWIVVCNGDKRREETIEERKVTFWAGTRANDIVILAAPDFKTAEIENDHALIEIYYTELPEDYVLREAEGLEKTLNLFTEILGPPSGQSNVFRYVYSPKEFGQGGYSRPGLVVASEGRMLRALEENPELTTLRGNAHETAHFWWNFGLDQGDWINEAFAEFFGLLAVEKIQSREKYQEIFERYQEIVHTLPDDAPSISQVSPENTEMNYIIRYYKGALMLHAFREFLGEEAFLDAACRFMETFRNDGARTLDFRRFWNEVIRDEKFLNRWLDSPGSDPLTIPIHPKRMHRPGYSFTCRFFPERSALCAPVLSVVFSPSMSI